ncbi:6-bladed beta-propeller [Puteibacter caeruleilacunae]|nr:6-bladed beta-propeller [Puteibacter caeruleilacunae]
MYLKQLRKVMGLLLLILFITSCGKNNSKQQNSTDDIIHFQVGERKSPDEYTRIKASELYSKVHGFELDKSGGPIGAVSKVMVYKDKLYVLDVHKAKELFVYDLKNKGRFLYKISSKGRGPGEYTMLTDFCIDLKNDQILIADPILRRISYFDSHGNFKKADQLDFNPTQIACKGDFICVICNTNKAEDAGVKIIDRNKNVVAELLPHKDYPKHGFYESGFTYVGDKLLLNYPYCETIFEVKGKSLKPYLTLNCNGKSFRDYVRENDIKVDFKLNLFDEEYKEVIIPYTYYENDKFRMFRYRQGGYRYVCQIKTLNGNGPCDVIVSDDIFNLAFNFKSYDQKYGTVCLISPMALGRFDKEQIKKNNQILSEQLIHDISKASIDSNPFILFYK